MKPTVSTPRNTIIDQKAKTPVVPKRDRPGKQERHFQIENDEQDRHQIEAHVEFHARIAEGGEAAFIGRQVFRDRAWTARSPAAPRSGRALRTAAMPDERSGSADIPAAAFPCRPQTPSHRIGRRTRAFDQAGPVLFRGCSIGRHCRSRNAGLAEDSRRKTGIFGAARCHARLQAFGHGREKMHGNTASVASNS